MESGKGEVLAVPLRNELIAICQSLIRTPSMSGDEAQVAEFLLQRMKAWGFDEVWRDDYGSVVGKITGTGGGYSVLFDGHMDTVPVSNPERWTFDPFGGELVNDRIYGRGASDMKGAIAAMIAALGSIALSQERLRGDLYFCGSVQEEVFEGIALGHILGQVHPDLVVIGEASELNLKTGQRGRAEVVVESHGQTAHSANPSIGINAVYQIMPAIAAVRGMVLGHSAELGDGIIELTDIISSPYPGASVVPDRCRTTWDRRLLVGETEISVLDDLRQALDGIGREDAPVMARIARDDALCYTGHSIGGTRFFPAWYFEPDHPLVSLCHTALTQVGIPAEFDVYSFCTNGSNSAGIRGIPTVGFGPSRENQAHVVDEYIIVAEMEQAYLGYMAIAKAVAK